jgi:DNA-binding transcriptional ArsR family regulator
MDCWSLSQKCATIIEWEGTRDLTDASERMAGSDGEKHDGDSIDRDLVAALAHPLRVSVLEMLNEGEGSPKEMAGRLGEPLGTVAYHCNVLASCGCIELVRREPRRGAMEHFFRAVPRSYIGHQSWRKVPRSVRGQVTGAALATFMDRAVAAMRAGTIDDREDSTLNWMTLAVDEAGWTQAAEALAAAIARLEEVHEQSRRRLAASGGKPIQAIVGLAAFEAAGRDGDAPSASGPTP